MSNAKKIQSAVASFLASFEAEQVPKGYYNARHLAQLHGTGPRNIALILRRFDKAGQILDKRNIRCHTSHGLVAVPYYKLSKQAEKVFGLTPRS